MSASDNELAVVLFIYSRKMGNVFHRANALKARIISTPARSATLFIRARLRRRRFSSSTYIGVLIWAKVSVFTFINAKLGKKSEHFQYFYIILQFNTAEFQLTSKATRKTNMARKKKPLPILENITIEDIAAEGKSLARVNDMVVFVPFAVPGDVVDLQVRKKKHHYC